MKMRIRKELKFEAGHQLATADCGLCKDTIHGHSYRVELFLVIDPEAVEAYDVHCMIIDFGSKEMLEIKQSVDSYYDHALILPEHNPDVSEVLWSSYLAVLRKHNKKFRVWDRNPTAEEIAKELFTRCSLILKSWNSPGVLEKVRVHETATGYAEWGVN